MPRALGLVFLLFFPTARLTSTLAPAINNRKTRPSARGILVVSCSANSRLKTRRKSAPCGVTSPRRARQRAEQDTPADQQRRPARQLTEADDAPAVLERVFLEGPVGIHPDRVADDRKKRQTTERVAVKPGLL